jgi:hypothetical protein
MPSKGLFSKVRNPHLTRVKDLTDVKITDIQNGDILVWDSVEKYWVNVTGAGGPVDHYVDGGSYDDGTKDLTLTRTDGGIVTIDLSTISGGGGTDLYIDNVEWSEITRDLTIYRSDGADWTVNISKGVEFDTYVESATWNSTTRELSLIRNDATTIIVNIPLEDDYVISGVFNNITRVLTLNRKDGTTIDIGIPGAEYGNWIKNETPTGLIDGANLNYTLLNGPYLGSVAVFKNGLKLHPVEDYTIAGDIITMVSAPWSGDKIKTEYIKV